MVEKLIPRKLLLRTLGMADIKHIYMSDFAKPTVRCDVNVRMSFLETVKIISEAARRDSSVKVRTSCERPTNEAGCHQLVEIRMDERRLRQQQAHCESVG